MLLTILELIDKGLNNCFYPDVELVGIFQENWRLLVNTPNNADFTLPYFHLQSEKIYGEPLWQLQALPGCQINAHIKSVNTLSKVVNFGSLHSELYALLTDEENRKFIREQLLVCYFPTTKSSYYQAKSEGSGYFHELSDWILNEPAAVYKKIIVQTEEEIYVRGGLFKRLVPQVYNHTCCISGMRLKSSFGHNYVDACHIVPFSVSHDDRVTNGLALCPNLHRAFDRGLIALDENYKVLLSKQIHEDPIHDYSLAKLAGKAILLPSHENVWPNQEMLNWHRNNRFIA